jgi:hypothetical protein
MRSESIVLGSRLSPPLTAARARGNRSPHRFCVSIAWIHRLLGTDWDRGVTWPRALGR